jgi:hypothetical protein
VVHGEPEDETTVLDLGHLHGKQWRLKIHLAPVSDGVHSTRDPRDLEGTTKIYPRGTVEQPPSRAVMGAMPNREASRQPP